MVQAHSGSREQIALFGYFEDCTQRLQECAFANSCALFDLLKRIAGEFGRVVIIMDRAYHPPQLHYGQAARA